MKYNPILYLQYLTFALTSILSACSSQRLPDTYGLHKVRLTEPDRSVVLEVIPVSHEPDLQTDRSYYWYSGGKVHNTQGGYSGKLLNGMYNEYYTGTKALKAQGQFDAGQKTGLWRNWNEDGSLQELMHWKKGQRSGKFTIYDGQGKLQRGGSYKNDLLQGKVLTYGGGDSVDISRYRDGRPIQKKVADTTKTPSFWHRYWPFSKKASKAEKVKAPKPHKVRKKAKLDAPDITDAP